MRRYLAELYKKPDHHKRQFALLASGTITLFIFGVWSIATFGINTKIIAEAENEVSPLQSLRMSMAASLEALRDNFGELKRGFEAVDFETRYQEMRDGALDVYDQ
ncbi:MAG: hypothetical protein UW76_C0010G0005 [Parcubacteria group bacterium GW2011_GWF2_44_8b]|nr:MAG: hypothetical protein UV94_C0017G0002 [Parcubacteria group bacterium GW2011_GWC1_43_30]KKT80642.1 MAG: hypothetical protein UW76_C0010G0005 [Parcubacteria group bacterium GW2011_GWF2_44_8b]